jgi:hypothetical protein
MGQTYILIAANAISLEINTQKFSDINLAHQRLVDEMVDTIPDAHSETDLIKQTKLGRIGYFADTPEKYLEECWIDMPDYGSRVWRILEV